MWLLEILDVDIIIVIVLVFHLLSIIMHPHNQTIQPPDINKLRQGTDIGGPPITPTQFHNHLCSFPFWVKGAGQRFERMDCSWISALTCRQKCAVEECRFLCAEKPCLIVAGMLHTHGCGVHRDMRIEAQAARLENAILDTRDREHREADRFCNATSSGIDWTRTKGDALYAVVKAGQDAFKHGASSVEVVAAIHAAAAKTDDP